MDAPAAKKGRFSSVTAIIVVTQQVPDAAVFGRMCTILAGDFADTDQIIVANGVDDGVAHALIDLCNSVPDTTLLFLPQRLDLDVAKLIGIENALGDWVLTATPTDAEIGVLPRLLENIEPGFEIFIGCGRSAPAASGFYTLLKRAFYGLYGRLTGLHPEIDPPRLRLYTRAAALHLVMSFDGEMLLKSRTVPGGFPSKLISLDYETAQATSHLRFEDAAGKGLRVLIASSTVPLRLVTVLSTVAAILALVYSVYIVLIYLSLDSVQRGWTTLSLEISGMMLLFSITFGLLSEYVIQIHAAASPRRHYVIAREVKSPHSRRTDRLNVVDQEGAHQLGAPRPRPAATADGKTAGTNQR